MTGLLRAAAFGAGCMYFLDPTRGKRRRALVRDQLTHFSRKTGDFLDKALRDAQHRVEGTVSEFSSAWHHEPVSDDVLVQRVRSRIGRYVSHPRAVEVSANDGCVVLSGAVRKAEVPGLLGAVWGVRGVRDVEDHTTPSEEADSSPAGQRMWGDQPELLQANWAPATRLFLGAAGTWMMLNCLVRRSPGAVIWGALGCGLVLNSMSNCPMSSGASVNEQARSELPEESEFMAGRAPR